MREAMRAWNGVVGTGMARTGEAGEAWLGTDCLGYERQGYAGMVRSDKDRCGTDRAGVRLWLPYPPSLNHIHMNVGRRRIKTDQYIAWEADAYQALLQQRPWKRYTGPVEVSVTLGKPDKRKRDLDNVGGKVILDLLVRYQIIRDDSDLQKITMAWGDEPGALIEVRET